MADDVLKVIPNDELPELSAFYAEHSPHASHVYSLLNTCAKWKRKKPDERYLTFFSLGGNWRSHGTFVLLMQYGCYDLFVFTMEKSCEELYAALTRTKLIDWTRPRILFYAVDAERHCPTVLKVLDHLGLPIDHSTETMGWWISKENALKFEVTCPEEVYLGKLDVSHAALVNSLWPHRSEGSEKYIATFIEMNEGHGVFLKSDGSLVAWVLKNHMGLLGILQTVEEHKRKGYASLVTKSMSKEIAEEGHDPFGTVVRGNERSEHLFRNLGFEMLAAYTYVETYRC